MFIGTATQKVHSKNIEWTKVIDQVEAWRQILDMPIRMHGEKSESFVSPFRYDRNPGCVLRWHKDKLRFMDSADDRFHGKTCVDVLSSIKGVTWTQALIMLKEDVSISMELSNKQTMRKDQRFVFKLLFDKRRWDNTDEEFFHKIGSSVTKAEAEKWIPIGKMSFNSHNNPGHLITTKTHGYAIEIFGRHKVYCPGEGMKFLSTVPNGVIGGISKLDHSLPLIINKSAKDHLTVSPHHNSRFIVNGEADFVNMQWIESALSIFPTIYLLYDNDETGIKYATKRAAEINERFNTDKVVPIWLPPDAKDPSDWHSTFGNIQIIKQLC